MGDLIYAIVIRVYVTFYRIQCLDLVFGHIEPSNSNVGQLINTNPRAAGIKYHAGTRIDMPFTEC